MKMEGRDRFSRRADVRQKHWCLSEAFTNPRIAHMLPGSPKSRVAEAKRRFTRILRNASSILAIAHSIGPLTVRTVEQLLFGDGLTSEQRAKRIACTRHLIRLAAATLVARDAMPRLTVQEMNGLDALEVRYRRFCCHDQHSDEANSEEDSVFSLLGVEPRAHAKAVLDLKSGTPTEQELFTHLLHGQYRKANALIHSEAFASSRSGAKDSSSTKAREHYANLLIADLLIRSLFHIQRCAAWTYVVGHGGKFFKLLGPFARPHTLKVSGVWHMMEFCKEHCRAAFDEFHGQRRKRGRPKKLYAYIRKVATAASRKSGPLPSEQQVRRVVSRCESAIDFLPQNIRAVAAERLASVNEVRRRRGEPELADLADLDLLTCQMHGIRPDALVVAMALCWLLMVERWKRLRNPTPSDHPVASKDWLAKVTAPPTPQELEALEGKRNALRVARAAKAGAGIKTRDNAGDHADPFGHDRRINEALVYLERVCQFLASAETPETDSDLYKRTMGAWRAFSPLAGR